MERFAFYAQAAQPQTCLVIATGEQRVYANILLTVGVVRQSEFVTIGHILLEGSPMTMALCFSCGYIKHGAICPCAKCGIDSTGDTELDILFSDHYMAHTTLTQFGKVVNLINERVSDKDIRFWTFMYYVSETHPGLLTITPPEPVAEQVRHLYGALQFPPVQVSPGIRNRDDLQSGGGGQTGPGRPAGEQSTKKWWQFWR